jgi:hypothetical protein
MLCLRYDGAILLSAADQSAEVHFNPVSLARFCGLELAAEGLPPDFSRTAFLLPL